MAIAQAPSAPPQAQRTPPQTQETPPGAESSVLKRAMFAGLIGHFVEWYDYGVYAYVATTLAVVFFASSDPTVALLATFATFSVAFLSLIHI